MISEAAECVGLPASVIGESYGRAVDPAGRVIGPEDPGRPMGDQRGSVGQRPLAVLTVIVTEFEVVLTLPAWSNATTQ